jgi:hypothetical protein
MQVVPPHNPLPSGKTGIVCALAPNVQSCFADILTAPIPEKLIAILRRMDSKPTNKVCATGPAVKSTAAARPRVR